MSKDYLEEIESVCPGDWKHIGGKSSLSFRWKIDDRFTAIIYGGPCIQDAQGSLVQLFGGWSSAITDKGKNHSEPVLVDFLNDAAQHVRDEAEDLGLIEVIDPDCEECGGTGKVDLFSHTSDCNTCKGST